MGLGDTLEVQFDSLELSRALEVGRQLEIYELLLRVVLALLLLFLLKLVLNISYCS